jgi:hypothetical protein
VLEGLLLSVCALVQVLEALLCEYDASPQTWYLLALAQYGSSAFEEALQSLKHGRTFLACLSGAELQDLRDLYSELQERTQEGIACAAAHAEEEEEADR